MKICTGIKSYESFEALVETKVDEFYCGVYYPEWVDQFGILSAINRRPWVTSNIDNFDVLSKITSLAKTHDKKVFLTLNEHIYSDEKEVLLMTYIDAALESGIDGFIASDIGVMELIRSISKETELHVSTGGAAFSNSTIEFYIDNFDVNRIILPRSVSLIEMNEMKSTFPSIDFEIFMLNEGCIYIDAYCNQPHGVQYIDETGKFINDYSPSCQVQFDAISLTTDETEKFSNNKNTYLNIINRNLHKRISCGLCSLYEINQMGIESLKLVSRSTDIDKTLSDVKRLTKCIEMSKKAQSQSQYLNDMKNSGMICDINHSMKPCLYKNDDQKKDADVCYIHSSSDDSGNHWVVPAGLAGLNHILKSNHISLVGLNIALEIRNKSGFRLENWLLENRYKVFLIELHWFIHLDQVLKNIELIKSIIPEAQIVMGGLTASLLAEKLMSQYQEIDYICIGDSEHTLPKLFRHLTKKDSSEGQDAIINMPNLVYRRGSDIRRTETQYVIHDFSDIRYDDIEFIQNYESLLEYPFPDTSFRDKSYWLLNGRGCNYSCKCCDGGHYINKKYFNRYNVSFRKASDVLMDSISVKEKYGVSCIYLTHDLSEQEPCEWQKYLSGIKKTGDLKVYNEFWQIPTEQFLDYVKECGMGTMMKFAITVHSGNRELIEQYGKFYSNSYLMHVLDFCEKNGVETTIFFSKNIPEETDRSLVNTMRLLREIKERNYENLYVLYEHLITDPIREFEYYQSKNLQVDPIALCNKVSIGNRILERDGRLNIMEKKIEKLIKEAGYAR